ncbi:MAG: potassium channel protein [Anaerolineales bacterium]|nr:potassium channel protein [Anaerolineales bacterium]
MKQLTNRFVILILLIVAVYLIGTAGYILIEQYSPLEALYMTAITLTTVGFSEVRPLSSTGRIFTILLIMTSVGLVALALATFSQLLLTPGIGEQLRRNRMQRQINRLAGHFIVCGFGALGSSVADTLVQNDQQIVVIEADPEAAELARQNNYLVIEGDGTQDEHLQQAGLEKARGLIACTQSDPDNLLIVFSGRALSPDIYIVSRALTEDAESKLMRAGANKVISPLILGGRHMANLAMRPSVMEFLELFTVGGELELALEEVKVGDESPLIGLTSSEADIRQRTGATLVSFRRDTEKETRPISGETRFQAGDRLIAVGTIEQLAALDNIAGSEK